MPSEKEPLEPPDEISFTDHLNRQYPIPVVALQTVREAANGETLRFCPESKLWIWVGPDGRSGRVQAESEIINWCCRNNVPIPFHLATTTTTPPPVLPSNMKPRSSPPPDLNPAEQAALKVLREKSPLSGQAVATRAGYSYDYMRHTLPGLVRRGLLNKSSDGYFPPKM